MRYYRVHPTAESLSILVVQSVHSGDKTLLEEALQESSERIVNGTVRNLPVTAVVPFLKTVSRQFVCTVETPNKGHFGTNIDYFVFLCREVVLFSEVRNVFRTIGNQLLRGLLYCVPISECPLLEVLLYIFSQYLI